MGFKPVDKTYLLEFADYPGLEIRATGASLEELDGMAGMNLDLMHKDQTKRLELFGFFVSKVLGWNIDHPAVKNNDTCSSCGLAEDAPMPPVYKSMLCLPMDLAVAITIGWATTISRVSLPKGLNSLPGGNSGHSIPLPDGMTDAIMQKLEELQSPERLPQPNFT